MNDLADQIARAHEESQRSGGLLRDSAFIPWCYDAITPEWLTGALCPTSPIVGLRLGPHDTGSTNRRRIYLTYEQDGAGPPSVFCKGTFELGNKILLAHTGATHSEVTFYKEIREELSIEAPRALYAAYDSESFNSLIVLVDMAGRAEFCDHRTTITRKLAEQQLSLLAQVHGRFTGPDTFKLLSTLRTWPQRFKGWEAAGTPACGIRGFEAARELMPTRLFARGAEVWPATVRAVDQHNHLPQTLCHGDVHLKNWYITSEGRIGLGDWQACSRAHWSRDLSYTLATSLAIEDRRAWERDLIACYLDQLQAAGGPRVGFEQAFVWYRQQMFHALASWTVTLTPADNMPDMQPKETSREFLSRITHAVDDLDSLDSFGDSR